MLDDVGTVKSCTQTLAERGGGVLRISSDVDDLKDFLGLILRFMDFLEG